MSSSLPPVLALAAPVSGRRVNVSSKTKLASASSQSMDEQGNEGRDSASNSCHTGIRSHNPLFSKKRKTSVDQMEREAVVSPVKLKRKRKSKKSKKNTTGLRTTRTAENLHTEENSSCCNADINKESLQKFENMLKQFTYNENKKPQEIPNYVESQIGNADATFSSTKIEKIEESKNMRKLQQISTPSPSDTGYESSSRWLMAYLALFGRAAAVVKKSCWKYKFVNGVVGNWLLEMEICLDSLCLQNCSKQRTV
ncbi:hypothetical protein KSP40_PGU000091 [Platanthera guangdongensis]|uniref:Uncharacterized protein n=1 Tax=Platanthera guangdongensis TaxID=2320717 RepID=A0ABR2M1M2_9ASPA